MSGSVNTCASLSGRPQIRLRYRSLLAGSGVDAVALLPNRGVSVRGVDAHLAENIYDVRKVLMALMMERCLLFITNSELQELDRLETYIHELDEVDHVTHASDLFYRRIFNIARNEVATAVLTGCGR